MDPKKATKSGQSTAEPQRAETMSKPLKVFLGGLPSDATVEDIQAELSKFGPISVSHCKGVWGGGLGDPSV